ncbi:MAG: tRNA (adenosine(37)-N6)-dimethylallyltransferase MiaA [Alistipes sp.]|nr:tRNA (adenosine(37)-N6)-dimethylallyltransferase MiaA [Alistipes senegalensis]MCM1250347.1 tRNA (adenosine(37)-N6)-dimethylallyltransferase MiaA [Alistipes sp.]
MNPKLIAIVGTNASGKSSVGLELARRYGGEIVSADSRQILRGYDLCSGKVTAEERRAVPHHLLDIADAGDYFSLADYQSKAYAAIDDIVGRGRLPFLVGGTGLYVNAVADGYDLVDAGPDEALRGRLECMTVEELAALLREKTAEIPAFLDINNKKRLVRACEVALSGRDLAETRTCRPRYDVLKLGVTWERPLLRQRIAERLCRRLEQGMIDEVRQGLEAGVPYEAFYNLGLEYRFIARYLRGEFSGYDEFVEKLYTAICQFAKRQMTWFRKDASIRWLDMQGDPLAEAARRIDAFLEK